MSDRISIHLGAFTAPLAEQLGIEPDEVLDHLQRDADALERLRIRRLLTEREAESASKRLVKRVASHARFLRLVARAKEDANA